MAATRLSSILVLAACVLAAGLFYGCGSATDAPATGYGAAPGAALGEPEDGGLLVLHMPAEPPHLNPFLESGGGYVIRVVKKNIFETLMVRNNETLEYEPRIAKSLDISEDRLVYTYNLDPRVRFSDGEPLTAEDVKFTFDAILNPANDTADIRSYLTNVDSVDIIDPHTIQITCSKPYFLHEVTFNDDLFILPKHIYGQGNFNQHPANRKPVGTGPFTMVKWETGLQMTLEKRDDYWGDTVPHVDQVMFKFIIDPNVAFQELQRQAMDVMDRVTPEQWVRHASTPRFEEKFNKFVMYSPADGYLGRFTWIGWNTRRPQFEDKRVRQALTMLLDRQRIVDTIFQGLARVVTGYDFPDSPEYDNSIEPWPYDPESARALLTEAGWVDSDRDGIREKDGVEFRYQWIYPTGSTEYDRLVTVYKEQLDKAGIDVTLRPLEWATFLESVYKRDFDACMMAWISPPESDPYQIWHSSQAEKGSNYVGFRNAEADRIIEEARLEFDRDKRAELYHRFHAILHEEQPYTFLFNPQRKAAVDKRVKNVKAYPLGFDIHEWWIPRAEQKYQRR